MLTLKTGILMTNEYINQKSFSQSSRKKSTLAFTFVEVVIALAIVSISLLSLIKLHIVNINMTDSAEMISQANFLAQEKIAEVLAAGIQIQGDNRGTFESNSLLFNWHTEIKDIYSPQLDSEKISGLKKISVDISWQQGVGKKHLRMSTLIVDREML